MRRFVLFFIVLALMVFLYPNPCTAETVPPGMAYGGALFQNGGKTNFAMQAAGNINFLSKENVSNVVTKQVYIRGVLFYVDDISLTGKTAEELLALGGYIIGERTYGKFLAAFGGGIDVEIKDDEENPARGALLAEGGWRPFDLLCVRLGIQYIPITDDGDFIFVYGGIGVTL